MHPQIAHEIGARLHRRGDPGRAHVRLGGALTDAPERRAQAGVRDLGRVPQQRLFGGALHDALPPDDLVGGLHPQCGQRLGDHPVHRDRHDVVADEPHPRGPERAAPQHPDDAPRKIGIRHDLVDDHHLLAVRPPVDHQRRFAADRAGRARHAPALSASR